MRNKKCDNVMSKECDDVRSKECDDLMSKESKVVRNVDEMSNAMML